MFNKYELYAQHYNDISDEFIGWATGILHRGPLIKRVHSHFINLKEQINITPKVKNNAQNYVYLFTVFLKINIANLIMTILL